MPNFESKELKRTFETLLLVDNIRTTPEETAATMPRHGMGMKSSGKQTPKDYEVAVIEHEAGEVSIGNLYKDPSAFAGKSIKVRGSVVKFNGDIMNKNWLHIQDGSAHNNKFDLTITTKDKVNVGEITGFEGAISLNKDFGSGYFYEVIMEDARLLSTATSQ